MKKITILSALFAISILNTKCGSCAATWADLVSSIGALFNEEEEVEVGQVVDLGVAITNLFDETNESCGSDDANASQYSMQVYFRPNEFSDFEFVGNAKYEAPPIGAGDKFADKPTFKLTRAGQFKFVSIADSENNVQERNEQNNNSSDTVGDRSQQAANNGLIIRVKNNGKPATAPTYFIAMPKSNLMGVDAKEVE